MAMKLRTQPLDAPLPTTPGMGRRSKGHNRRARMPYQAFSRGLGKQISLQPYQPPSIDIPMNVSYQLPSISVALGRKRGIPLAYNRIETDPRKLGGVPVIKGTRIPVAAILACLADGYSRAEVLQDFKGISEEDIKEALLFACDLTNKPGSLKPN